MNKMNPKPTGEASELRVPTDLRKALAATPMAKTQWSDLTPIARRDFISWIESAKQPETRRRRIEKACSMLIAGKRRPCFRSFVSLNLHQAHEAPLESESQAPSLSSLVTCDLLRTCSVPRRRELAPSTPFDQSCRPHGNRWHAWCCLRGWS